MAEKMAPRFAELGVKHDPQMIEKMAPRFAELRSKTRPSDDREDGSKIR